MIEVANVSSKGQLVIPKIMREEIGLHPQDKVILVNDMGGIFIKKIQEAEIKSRMLCLIKSFTQEFKKAGITEEDIAKEIKAVRRAK